MSESEWHKIQQALQQPEAFRELYELYHAQVYRLLYRRVQDDELAKDLTQDTFLKAMQQLHNYRPSGTFGQWLVTIALNELRRQMKRLSKRSLMATPGQFDQLVAETQLQPTDHSSLKAAMERLKPKDMLLLELHYFEQLSYSQVAEVLGKKESAVKTQASRLIKRLKQEVQHG